MNAPTSPLTNLLIAAGTTLILATVGFLGTKTMDSNDRLTEFSVLVPALADDIAELKDDLTDLVTQPELEARVAEFKTELEVVKSGQQRIERDLLLLRDKQDILWSKSKKP